jgi:2,3-dihydroxy-p-cumate/2,3-dihydroxybenzoate 3,4-dioxygenase
MAHVDFRYRKFGYVALNVSDLGRSTAFATEVFGLDTAGDSPAGDRFFRASPSHHDLIMRQGDPAFVRSGWELESDEDLDKAYAHYGRIGVTPHWVPAEELAPLGIERAFRIHEPIHGTCMEYYARMAYIAAPLKNHLTSFYGQAHFGLMVPEPRRLTEYMVANMGFKISDFVENWFASLLRAFPNPNHHSFAPVKSMTGDVRFHHIAFMVNSIDDIGKLFNRLKRHNVKIQFGIGRHPTSGSIHLYIYGPDYFVWEYTLGMEQFPEVGARQARRMSSSPENFDLWGAMPEMEDMGKHPKALVQMPEHAVMQAAQ